jgi:hypothetical protein
MSHSISGSFETRRHAEMAVERLVQEFGIERTDIFIAALGDANSAGTEADGSDNEAASPSPDGRDDAALNGEVTVSVDLNDDAIVGKVLGAFDEFGASAVDQQ